MVSPRTNLGPTKTSSVWDGVEFHSLGVAVKCINSCTLAAELAGLVTLVTLVTLVALC